MIVHVIEQLVQSHILTTRHRFTRFVESLLFVFESIGLGHHPAGRTGQKVTQCVDHETVTGTSGVLGRSIEEHRDIMGQIHGKMALAHGGGGYCWRSLGSRRSRRASPKRLKPKTARLIAMPGKMGTQGALSAYSWAPP